MTDKDGLEVVAYCHPDAIQRLKDEPSDWMLIYGQSQHPHKFPLVTLSSAQAAVDAERKVLADAISAVQDQTQCITELEAAVTAERLKWSTALDLARVKQKSIEEVLGVAREALQACANELQFSLCDEYAPELAALALIDSVMGVKE
jgi:hypothetical protein